jgi:hypothetical protein
MRKIVFILATLLFLSTLQSAFAIWPLKDKNEEFIEAIPHVVGLTYSGELKGFSGQPSYNESITFLDSNTVILGSTARAYQLNGNEICLQESGPNNWPIYMKFLLDGDDIYVLKYVMRSNTIGDGLARGTFKKS